MFEGLVRQLLLGYLGRYVKDFQKDQLKITFWNEEVLLENVELNLEAFDYLQLPLGLKQGRVGRLSIKIPWKKLGWDPIIIILEDVFLCASQRDEKEWRLEAVEQREFAGKKARLATAELAKLSRRVCDNQVGQSFISYITAKILDSIQVSIRNVHAVYHDRQKDSANVRIGLRFSSLTIMKQSSIGSTSGKVRGGQVNKFVEIVGLEFYCSMWRGDQYSTSTEGPVENQLWCNDKFEDTVFDSILTPFDVTLSLMVNRSGKLDTNAPQYSLSAEISCLAMSVDEVRLQQLLLLWDCLCTCELREKYGRFRPWSVPISRNIKGWKIAWWHYAQESVLSDVRKKLMKTSWRYLGWKLSVRRKYINLYKKKLDILRHDQPINENLLLELEQMEKETDIDDILNYRFAAENETKVNSLNSFSEVSNINSDESKSENDDRSVGRQRGWLNWLSRGMLGAGGTDDSSQFSGVVSDDVIKDIYEATKFHPVPVAKEDSNIKDQKSFYAMKLSIHQLSAKLRYMKLNLEIVKLILNGVTIESKICTECATITAFVNSAEMSSLCNNKSILLMNKPFLERPSFSVQVDISTAHSEIESSVKVVFQPLDITCDLDFFLKSMEFYDVLKSFKFQHERVLASLNGVGNVKDRFLSKSQYILSRRKKVIWDVSIINIILTVPCTIENSEPYSLVFQSGVLHIISKSNGGILASDINDQASILRNVSNSRSSNDLFEVFQFQILYDHFDVKLNDLEVKIVRLCPPVMVPVCEKFGCSITFASCIIPDESILKQFVVHICLSSLYAHLSPSIYEVILGLVAHINTVKLEHESVMLGDLDSRGQLDTNISNFSFAANFDSVNLLLNLENDGTNSSIFAVTLHAFNIRYALAESEEGWICLKGLKVITYVLKGENDSKTLCSTGNLFNNNYNHQHDLSSAPANLRDFVLGRSFIPDGCFCLYYEAARNVVGCKFKMYLNDAEFHCYPKTIGLLVGFFSKLSSYSSSSFGENSPGPVVKDTCLRPLRTSRCQKFGFSNFVENGSPENASISLEHFPFVTIKNPVLLGSLEGSFVYPLSEWRKYFNLRERKIRNSKFSIKESLAYNAASHSSDGTDLIVFDLNLSGSRVHFHDSSCIIATATLPLSKAMVSCDINTVDILISVEELTISSPWWTKNIIEPLWGASQTNLSPVLNVRVRKGSSGSLISRTDICFGVQHVCCILPSEFLSIIIGYFSLPEWSPNINVYPTDDITKNREMESISVFTYKFEILDSVLISPVESDDRQFVILDIPQLCGTFIEKNSSLTALKYIPAECLVSEEKVAEENHSLNIFGRDLSLSLRFKDRRDPLHHNKDTRCETLHLLALFSADVWLTIPLGSELSSTGSPAFTCIMTQIIHCHLIANDGTIFGGLEALGNIVNQFSSVVEESEGFTDDVLQFLQYKKAIKEHVAVVPVVSSISFTELRCWVNSLKITFYPSRVDSISSESVVEADMQLGCSSSFRNDALFLLDLSVSSFVLNSMLRSLKLAECLSTCESSSVLDFKLSIAEETESKLFVSLPSLNIWLHYLEWNEVINLLRCNTGKLTQTSATDTSLKNLDQHSLYQTENVPVIVSQNAFQSPSELSSSFPLENKNQDTFVIIGTSDDIGVTCHFPDCSREDAFPQFEAFDDANDLPQCASSNSNEPKHSNFVKVTLFSKRIELTLCKGKVRVRLNLEKVSGEIGVYEDMNVHSWPLMQISQVHVDAEILNNENGLLCLNLVVKCDRLDVCLSHHVFYFWHVIGFTISETGSSQLMLGNLNLEVQLKKVSLVLTDGRWSCNGPLLEVRMKNIRLLVDLTGNNIQGVVNSDLQVNYNNIHKILWEPFVEPTKVQLSINRRIEMVTSLNSSMMTDFSIQSTEQLNINVTESLIESIFRAAEMIKDALGLLGPNDTPERKRFPNDLSNESICAGRYAPYIVQNLTSLPLIFHVYQGVANTDEFDLSSMKERKSLKPGSSVAIYIHETSEQQLARYSPAHSSDRLSDKQSSAVAHHFVTIQFDGTSIPSVSISMDLVGLTYFEVDLTMQANKMDSGNVGDAALYRKNFEEEDRTNTNSGFVVPVVFDVSVQRYSKLVRLYSTVILLNRTPMPLELRFDIPFGVSPKMLDPLYPGQEFPLPLHLAEAGRLRWRPLGNSYLWSEAHILANILSKESRIGFLRSFVCYPSLPSSDPFHCCISVQDIGLPSSGRSRKDSSLYSKDSLKQAGVRDNLKLHDLDNSKKRYIHQVTLSTPLLVKNYLPEAVSLTIESGGVTRTALLSEAETSFFHIDCSYDLGLVFDISGYKPSSLKFQGMDTFKEIAKLSGTRFSQLEVLTFDSDLDSGPMCVMVEKIMDAFSGAREVCIFVLYLLYNCTGVPLIISEYSGETVRNICSIPSCYDLVEEESLHGQKDGLAFLLSSQEEPFVKYQQNNSTKSHILSARNTNNPCLGNCLSKPIMLSGSSIIANELLNKHDSDDKKASSNSLKSGSSSSVQLSKYSDLINENGKVKPCMYSPKPNSSTSEIMVRLSRSPVGCDMDNLKSLSWSNPFFLVPPSGSTNVFVPQKSTTGASIISVTSNAVAEPFVTRTKIITFQPRYVISNACSKDLCFKQKGTDSLFHLGVGQHSHLHWTDTTREMLVSIRFNEPGWQWSGSFLPDHLGDTQVKMRNHVSGASNMIRIEVQNADVSIQEENIVGNLHGNSGTNLILISDDDTGFMPYRIDNFSKERLRLYQQRCETFETVVHSYTSCPYAWDEPFYPHRLIVEVPGERVLGSYTLDDVKEYVPVHLPSNSEKPERTFLVSVHAEGAMKVFSIIDSNYHVLKDMKDPSFPQFKGIQKHDKEEDKFVNYRERISVAIPTIGISVINCLPQELLFASAKNITVDLIQSPDQQKLSFQIACLQIDNQLDSSPYPVLLSFNHDYKSNLASQMRVNDGSFKSTSENMIHDFPKGSWEPVLCLSAAKWRNKDSTLLSYKDISLRIGDFSLELEQEVILSLFDFYRMVSSRFQSRRFPHELSLHFPNYNIDFRQGGSTDAQPYEYLKAGGGQLVATKIPMLTKSDSSCPRLPSIVPIGAPWQRIYLLAKRQKKIYVEVFYLAPIRFSFSFSSTPWKLRNGLVASGESLIHRGLMALADVEGAQIKLKQLTISHHMGSFESIEGILLRHYMRQLLHEMYKVFGSAGVIGNPMGFARSLGLGIKDFLSAPARSFFHSPTGIITGVAQGTTSLLSNTVYAISDATSQISRAAHKGIVAFTFDDQAVAKMEKQQKGIALHGKGVINEVLEGLTGLLQLPIRGAEKHGLPGVVSGIALGVTGLVAKPAASILEVTGKTAQSIRNRSKLHQIASRRFRARLPRPLSRELPLRPYSWEEAVGTFLLWEADGNLKLKDETFVMCKALIEGGKFVVITKRLILVVSCSSLQALGKPEFQGVPADPEWVIEAEIGLQSVIHADTDESVVHIVGSNSEAQFRQNQHQQKRGSGSKPNQSYNHPTSLPFFQTNFELTCKEEADRLLQTLLSAIAQGKEQGWGSGYILHQSSLKSEDTS